MCGILGTVNLSIDERTLGLLGHRGPDGSGLEHFTVGRHRVTLGHRRLAILDLSPAGHQPMLTPDGRYAITFNGEIYNHLDLRERLHDVAFRGHSDTETMLHHLRRFGIDGAAQFNGIFAFALLDVPNSVLYLARDPFGVKPLYYWCGNGSLAFSSEIRPLRAFSDGVPDPEKLAELLRLRYLPAPDTLFRDIRKLRPGHVLELRLRGSSLSMREYPFIGPVAQEPFTGSRAEALERYGVLLEQAVRRQLLSDVQAGVLLSGGVDSALVGHFAQRHAPYRMKAFTVGYSGTEDADEIADARLTAAAIGLEHHVVRVGADDFWDALPRILRIVEEPLATTSVFPMYYLSQLAGRNVKVALSGQGADEAMGGYRRYQAEMLRPIVPRAAAPLLRAAAHLSRRDALLRGVNTLAEADDTRRFLSAYTVFDGNEVRSLIGHDDALSASRIEYFFDLLQCRRQQHGAERMMSLDLRMNLADDLLLYTDRITMHHSFECRVPLLDLDMVRFLEDLPCRYRVGLLRGKALHKEFARKVLPAGIVNRPKKGFLVPTSAWFRETGLLRDALLEPASRFATYFDRQAVERVIVQHERRWQRERQLFLLLSIRFWLDALNEDRVTATAAAGARA